MWLKAGRLLQVGAPRMGIVGAGQLARMTHQAAISLGLSVRLLADERTDAAALVASDVTIGSARDERALAAFAAGCDVVTVEHELVDATALERLEGVGMAAIRPSSSVLRTAQDKARQRTLLDRLGLPTPANAVVADAGSVRSFAQDHGWPVVLKSATGGYDGRGVVIAGDDAGAAAAHGRLSRGGSPVLAESFVDLDSEMAVLVARAGKGTTVAWPVVGTVQVDGVCREMVVPCGLSGEVEATARRIGLALAEALDVVGVLAVELFVDRSGIVLVNEIAARPHNSGHWTIEGAITSQFENHVRAVLGWGLGNPSLTAPAVACVNVLGPADGSDPADRLADVLRADPAVKVHLYGKSARPGRKLGHVTALGGDTGAGLTRARAAAQILTGER